MKLLFIVLTHEWIMDNCGISFGNDLKYVANGDTIIALCQFSIVIWQAPPARQTEIGNMGRNSFPAKCCALCGDGYL